MTLRPRFLVIIAVALVPAMTAAQDTALSPDEIRATIVGKKVFARSARNGQLMDYSMRSDGTAVVSVGNFTDTGTWRFNNAGYCATWQKLREGKEACFTVVRRGSGMVVLEADGAVNTHVLRVSD